MSSKHLRSLSCVSRLVSLFIIILLAITSQPSNAQIQTGSIVGTVQDVGGSILVSARVTVEPTGAQAATNDQGQFRISNLPPGDYTVTVSYVGFASSSTSVKLQSGQVTTLNQTLKVASGADTVLVTAARLQGEAEAINIERMSSDIVQILPERVITSLPNTNIADAVGRLPSVSLERDEGEGKYVQIRGTEPRLSNVTINGVNVPSPEVTVRNIKLDAVPSDIVERIEVYKTLSPDQDGDGIGGNVNLVTKTALDRPTYTLSGTTGYNPIQNGYWRGGFDGTFGQRFGVNKQLGFLLGGTWDRTNRGIDDLEPTQAIGTDPGTGNAVALTSTADLRSYNYYRTRYGFNTGIDYKFTPTTTAYVKGLYADFHDYGDTIVYTPTVAAFSDGTPAVKAVNGNQLTFYCTDAEIADPNNPCTPGNYAYRHYIRRPDQQIFSVLTGVRQDFTKDFLVYNFAVSRGHNIGGQDFPTTSFTGNSNVPFTLDLANPRRPKFNATDGSSLFDATQYGVSSTDSTRYHATQLNFQGDASYAHNFTVAAKPSTFSLGVKVRNSSSIQTEDDQLYGLADSNVIPFTLANVVGGYTNPTYYNKSFAINGQAYGPTSNYNTILSTVAANPGAFALDTVGSVTQSQAAFFNVNERVTAGYVQDVIFVGKWRFQGGVRFEGTSTHFLANQLTANVDSQGNSALPTITPIRQDTSYFNALPSVQAQYQLQKDTNLRLSYGRGISRPNIGDLAPSTTVDPNASPKSITKGNPALQPTKANNYDVLIEHYFQPLGILRAGYFYKQLSDPIFPTTTQTTDPQYPGIIFQLNQSINGPSAHIQGIETQWEQRFSFLPGPLSGIGISANYSYVTSQITFPTGFNAPTVGATGRTDKPRLQRDAPNNYNFNLTYDKGRFSSRFAISHNDANIYAYQWGPGIGPVNDPILGLKGPKGDQYLYPHTQFDIQGSYRTYKGVQLVVSGLNLSNEVFGFYDGSEIYPIQREYYRPTVSFGLRWVSGQEQ
jgi:TonB-dependent receptor